VNILQDIKWWFEDLRLVDVFVILGMGIIEIGVVTCVILLLVV